MPNDEQVAPRVVARPWILCRDTNSRSYQALHRHIVRFLGFCSNKEINLLVYEYMPNGSLGEVLYGKKRGHLHWDTRFVLAFALGAGPVPGLLLPEIFPNRIRAKAMAICMSVHWVVNFFVGLLFLRLLEQLGAQVLYSMFATSCAVAAVFVRRNVVETKGMSLQEIEISLLPPE